MLRLLALNPLEGVDIALFIALGAVILIGVAVYFLIPIFNKKQYKEQRENLKKREVAFKANTQKAQASVAPETAEGQTAEPEAQSTESVVPEAQPEALSAEPEAQPEPETQDVAIETQTDDKTE